MDKLFITPKQAKQMLEIGYKTNSPIMFWGTPGLGKSELIKKFAIEKNLSLIDLRLALKDPSDIQGLPGFENANGIKTTTWSLPDFFPRDPNFKGILFLDEFNLSQPAVQSACYTLIQDRVINNYKLPEGVYIVAASNPSDCNINANELPAALKNRFKHFYIREDLDSWIEWALNNGVNEDVIAFLKTQKPELLLDHESMDADKDTYATPRTWVSVSNILNDNSIKFEDKKTWITGEIGAIATTQLFNYIEDKVKYQNPQEIIDGKDFKYNKITEFYGTFISLISKLNKMNDKDLQKGVLNTINALGKLKNDECKVFASKIIVQNGISDKVSDDIKVKLVNLVLD